MVCTADINQVLQQLLYHLRTRAHRVGQLQSAGVVRVQSHVPDVGASDACTQRCNGTHSWICNRIRVFSLSRDSTLAAVSSGRLSAVPSDVVVHTDWIMAQTHTRSQSLAGPWPCSRAEQEYPLVVQHRCCLLQTRHACSDVLVALLARRDSSETKSCEHSAASRMEQSEVETHTCQAPADPSCHCCHAAEELSLIWCSAAQADSGETGSCGWRQPRMQRAATTPLIL
jgi:hypothetical protein